MSILTGAAASYYWQGLEADLPTPTNVAPNTICRAYTTDTQLWRSWNGTKWILEDVASPAPVDGNTAAQQACNIAGYLSIDVIRESLQQALNGINQSKNTLWFGALITTLIPGVGWLYGVVSGLADVLYLLYATIGSNSGDFTDALADDSLFARITCAIYDAIATDGHVDCDNFSTILTNISAVSYTHSDVISAIHDYVQGLGCSGLMALQNVGALADYDCTNCGTTGASGPTGPAFLGFTGPTGVTGATGASAPAGYANAWTLPSDTSDLHDGITTIASGTPPAGQYEFHGAIELLNGSGSAVTIEYAIAYNGSNLAVGDVVVPAGIRVQATTPAPVASVDGSHAVTLTAYGLTAGVIATVDDGEGHGPACLLSAIAPGMGPQGPTGAAPPTVAIDSDTADIVAIDMAVQAGPPSAPGAGHVKVYAESGGWYYINSAGATGPIGPTGSSGSVGPTGPTGPAGGGALAEAVASGSSNALTVTVPGGTSCRNLRFIVQGQSSTTSGYLQANLTLNGDTAAHYTWHDFYYLDTTSGGSNYTSQTSLFGGWYAPSDANYWRSITEGIISDWASTTAYKGVHMVGGGWSTAHGWFSECFGTWLEATAVSTITATLGSGNWVAGSTLTLYAA